MSEAISWLMPRTLEPVLHCEPQELSRLGEHGLDARGVLLATAGAAQVSCDLLADAAGRAAALAPLLPAGVILVRRAAVWVHTGALPTEVLDVVVPPGVLAPPRRIARRHAHRIDQDEQVRLAGLTLTSPLRTAVDAARHLAEPQARHALLALASGGVDLKRARAQVPSVSRGHTTTRARRVLDWAIGLCES